jgi:cobalt/nickel transport system permease protein
MLLAPFLMHIPDGFLSITVSVVLWVATIVVVAYALKRVNKDLGERQVPLMGVLAAAIFAGQMLNFSVAGGTSGHLVGAAIAVILLGPWAAILVMVCVVSIQALIFQDGGLVVLGANIFNMGITGVAVSYMVYHTVRRLLGSSRFSLFVGGFMAAWTSVEVSALSVALQLAVSGTSPANLAIPAMGAVHALIGIGEGLITVGALAFLYATRGDLIEASAKPAPAGPLVWGVGLLLALGLAIVSPWASRHPDGLEWVARQQGFFSAAQHSALQVIPKYLFPGVSNSSLARILAGLLGTLIVFGVALGVAYVRSRRPQ